MKYLVIWPDSVCPICGEEYDEHTKDCTYLQSLENREAKAKQALEEFGAEQIDDILSLVDMQGCDSLYGDAWRLIKETSNALEMQIMALESVLPMMRTKKDGLEQHISKIESKWLGEDYQNDSEESTQAESGEK